MAVAVAVAVAVAIIILVIILVHHQAFFLRFLTFFGVL